MLLLQKLISINSNNMHTITRNTTMVQTIVRIIIGIFLCSVGIGHLTFMRTEFLAQVPNWVPMKADTVVLLSGVVEITLGLALVFLIKYRTAIGWIVASFLVAVFPGNIAQLVNLKYAFGLNSQLLLWFRLPFQPVLIALVFWSTGAWREWRGKIKNNQLVQSRT